MNPRRPITAEDKLSIHVGVTARDFDGEWILLDLNGGMYFGLDEIGGLVWQHLSSGRTAAEIARVLAASFHAPEELILDDILRLMNELVERNLVKFDG